MYHAEGCHEAIISSEVFQAVQEEKERRARKHKAGVSTRSTYPFTGLLQCANCRKNYRRKITHGGPVWICNTFNTQEKAACPSKQIPETILTEVTAGVLGTKTVTEEKLRDTVSSILVSNGNRLIYKLFDGDEVERTWQDRADEIGAFMFEVSELQEPVQTFDEALWRTIVERVTVNRDGGLLFRFTCGHEVLV